MAIIAPGDQEEDGTPIHGEREHGLGAVGYVSEERRERDAVQRLRDVVAEVTRGRIPAPVRRGPRF